MKIGICLPYMKPGLSRDDLLTWFKIIDDGPFESLSCGERVHGPTFDMRLLLSAAAAATTRVEITPTLYVLPMHNAVRVAKEIASLNVIFFPVYVAPWYSTVPTPSTVRVPGSG